MNIDFIYRAVKSEMQLDYQAKKFSNARNYFKYVIKKDMFGQNPGSHTNVKSIKIKVKGKDLWEDLSKTITLEALIKEFSEETAPQIGSGMFGQFEAEQQDTNLQLNLHVYFKTEQIENEKTIKNLESKITNLGITTKNDHTLLMTSIGRIQLLNDKVAKQQESIDTLTAQMAEILKDREEAKLKAEKEEQKRIEVSQQLSLLNSICEQLKQKNVTLTNKMSQMQIEIQDFGRMRGDGSPTKKQGSNKNLPVFGQPSLTKSISFEEQNLNVHSHKIRKQDPSIRNMLEVMDRSPQNSAWNESSPSRNRDQSIDMVYLYADPIVREDNGKIVACETPLNLEEEYPMVLETLKSTGKHFSIKKEPINYQSLSLIIQQRPKILHISSHGFFDKKSN